MAISRDIPDYFTLDTETVRYTLERFRARLYFAPSVLATVRMEAMQVEAQERFGAELSMMVAAWRQDRILEVPANWWQHFKQRWLPKWALKRWPVLTTTYDAISFLPQVPIPDPRYGTVEFQVLKPTPPASFLP